MLNGLFYRLMDGSWRYFDISLNCIVSYLPFFFFFFFQFRNSAPRWISIPPRCWCIYIIAFRYIFLFSWEGGIAWRGGCYFDEIAEYRKRKGGGVNVLDEYTPEDTRPLYIFEPYGDIAALINPVYLFIHSFLKLLFVVVFLKGDSYIEWLT